MPRRRSSSARSPSISIAASAGWPTTSAPRTAAGWPAIVRSGRSAVPRAAAVQPFSILSV